MIQSLLVVTAGIIGEFQFHRQVTLVTHILQSLNNGGVIANAASGRNIASGDRVVILAMHVENMLAAQHIDGPFRIDMLVDQMIGIQLDAKIRRRLHPPAPSA